MKMTDKALVAGLSREQHRELHSRSDLAGMRQFALHFGLVLAGAGLIRAEVPYWPVLLLPHGIALIFLFTALHETIHRTAFGSDRLNDLVAGVCGFLVLLPPNWFRQFHFAHHRYTNDPPRDPELAVAKPASLRDYLLYLSGLPVWASQIRKLIGNAFGAELDAFVAQKDKAAVRREARVYLACYLGVILFSIAMESTVLVWTWLVPALLGQPFLRAYLLAEHAGCPLVPDMLENSRTTLTNPLVLFFTWNMPYHAEHHLLPAVPFWKLPMLYEITRPHLSVTQRGYARFHAEFAASLLRARG